MENGTSFANKRVDCVGCYRWLIDNVITNYKTLDERVQRDMADYAIQVQKDKEEWRSRVGAKNSAEFSDDGLPRNGNPFQPIDQLIVCSRFLRFLSFSY